MILQCLIEIHLHTCEYRRIGSCACNVTNNRLNKMCIRYLIANCKRLLFVYIAILICDIIYIFWPSKIRFQHKFHSSFDHNSAQTVSTGYEPNNKQPLFNKCGPFFDNETECFFAPLSDTDLTLIDRFLAIGTPTGQSATIGRGCGFGRFSTPYLIENTDGLAYCPIAKTGVSVVKSFLCGISFPARFPLGNVFDNNGENGTSTCKYGKMEAAVAPGVIKRRVIVLRDPFSRLMSAWSDKCLRTYAVDPDINPIECPCLQNTTLDCLFDYLELIHRLRAQQPQRVLFEDKNSYLYRCNPHFTPQIWACQLEKSRPNRILLLHKRNEQYYEDWENILGQAKVDNNSINIIGHTLRNLEKKRATLDWTDRHKVEDELLESPSFVRRFLQSFYDDYAKLRLPLDPRLRNAINKHLDTE